jgi:RNA polymerase sigma-70 factor (ECF subfamily)
MIEQGKIMNIIHQTELQRTAGPSRAHRAATTRKPLNLVNCHLSIFVTSHAKKYPQNRVTVMFGDSSHSFLAPQAATLGEIVARVDEIGARRKRHATSLRVTFTKVTPPQACAQKMIDAFRKALLAEAPQLRPFAISLARNRDRADDLVQETLAKAWAHQTMYREDTNLRAWLFTILRNTYYNELRSRRREVSDSDGYYAAQLVSPASQFPYIQLKDFARAFAKLTGVQQQALALVTIYGETYDYAASIGNCAVGTIKSRIFRARESLQRQLNG